MTNGEVIEMALAENSGTVERPELRLVQSDSDDVCPDCFGTLVVVDVDGSVSGTVGTLIDCICVDVPGPPPPGFVECGHCAALVPVPDPRENRLAALLAAYVEQCEVTGTEPAWCPDCGEYRPEVDDARATCACVPDRGSRTVVEDDYTAWCRWAGVTPVGSGSSGTWARSG